MPPDRIPTDNYRRELGLPEASAGNKRTLKNSTIALMVSVALFIDGLQIFFEGTIVLPSLIDIFAFLTFYVWFKIHGMQFLTPKRMTYMTGGFILELIPVLNALPALTLTVILLILNFEVKNVLPEEAQTALRGRADRYRNEYGPVFNAEDRRWQGRKPRRGDTVRGGGNQSKT